MPGEYASVSGPSSESTKSPRLPTEHRPPLTSASYHNHVRKSRPGWGSSMPFASDISVSGGRSVSFFFSRFIMRSSTESGTGSTSDPSARVNSITKTSNLPSEVEPKYSTFAAVSTTKGTAEIVGTIFGIRDCTASSLMRRFSFRGTKRQSFACMYASSSRRQTAFSSWDGTLRSVFRRFRYGNPPHMEVVSSMRFSSRWRPLTQPITGSSFTSSSLPAEYFAKRSR